MRVELKEGSRGWIMNHINIECICTIPSGDSTLIGKVCKGEKSK